MKRLGNARIVDILWRITNFSSSNDYWEKRYSIRHNSGKGSSEYASELKSLEIKKIIEKLPINTIVDYGVGDSTFLSHFLFEGTYIGLDISKTIIEKNLLIWRKYPNYQFLTMEQYSKSDFIKRDMNLSLDVILHLVEDEVFYEYMSQLFTTKAQYILIYSTNHDTNPNFINPHVRHRLFTNYVADTFPEYRLLVNGKPVEGLDQSEYPARIFLYSLI